LPKQTNNTRGNKNNNFTKLQPRVRWASTLITSVQTRPKTLRKDIPSLFYSRSDEKRFRKEAETETILSMINEAKSNDVIDTKDTKKKNIIAKESCSIAKDTSKSNHYQEKVARRIKAKQLAKQQKAYDEANEDALIESYVTKEEDEITAVAKRNNAKLRLFNQVLHKTQQNKPSLFQKGRNASYNIGTTFSKALSSILQPEKKRVQFAKETATRMFDKQNESIVLMTYDSGADGHYMSEKDRKRLQLPILKQSTKRVGVANGDVVQGKYKTTLPLPQLSTTATTADSFNTWPSSLVSVGKIADDNTVSIFDKDGVSVFKEEDVLIKCNGDPLFVGKRDERGRYRIPLIQKRGQWQPRHPSKKAKKALEQANSVYDLPSTEQAIKWMHAVCGYPVKSTWLKAIKAGNFIGWPMLTEKNVNKYYPETVETPKGHLNQSRKNVRSTKAKPLEEYTNKHQLEGKKEKDVYIKVYDAKETIYSDQTGAFPTRSRSGNKYIMVMVHIDSNAILVEPIKSRKDAEMIRAYNALMLRLTRAGIMPAKHVLDNEVSENMKDHIRDKYKLTLELVPPGCHRRNAAEVAIRNFKSHFLSVLAGVSDDFPPSLWDKLLPQTEITLNLLRQSNATPTVSAYAHLSGPFDYNKMPLAPMGCKAQIHEKSDKRGTWSYHTIDGWYIRTSPEHYRTHICTTKDTKSERLTDTVQFQHKHITNPTLTHGDKLMNALAESMKVLKGKGITTEQQMKDLKQIIQDTKQQVKSNPQSMNNNVQGTTPTPVPRVQSEIEPVPRVQPTENVRITRSMSSNNNMNNIINNSKPSPVVKTITNSNNNMGNSKGAITTTNNNTVHLSTSRKRQIKRLIRQALMDSNNDGPASRTRSKVAKQIQLAAPPAASTRAAKAAGARVSKIPKPTPRYLRATKNSRLRSQQGTASLANNISNRHKISKKMNQLENEVHQALAVMDEDTGKMLNYRSLLKIPKFKKLWSRSAANEFGRLANGVGGRIKNPTNTIKFICENEIPKNRKKDVTYGQMVCTVRPEKEEKERSRFVAGGDQTNFPGEVATPTADMLVAKILMNSVVSTKGARFMTMDISNFYLNTPMSRPEYIRIRLSDIPDEIIKEYKLNEKVTPNGSIYIQVNKGMYGLPQSGLMANVLLEKRLNKKGYYQSKLVPGLWKHKTRPIAFALTVDDFAVKYVGKEHALHLKSVLEQHYKITTDWTGKRYIGMTLDWDYEKRQVHVSMPGYVEKSLKQFGHVWNGKKQHAPFPSAPIRYGAKKQYATEESNAPELDKKGKKFIQQVCGKFLYLGRAVDSTLLCPISAIASQSSKPTEDTMKQAQQLLDYLASQEDAVITYNSSDMVLGVHSDASYLSEPKARSRAGGHFFLSNNSNIPTNNGAILNIAHIIKHVMSSATEAELAALYIMAREAVYIRIILEELGHKQPPTPLQTDNAMADAVVNGKIQPKRTKAMDMRLHWLRDRECQQQFRIYWRPGKLNYADYWTKHHAAKHHKNIRSEYLTPHIVVEMLRMKQEQAAAAVLRRVDTRRGCDDPAEDSGHRARLKATVRPSDHTF